MTNMCLLNHTNTPNITAHTTTSTDIPVILKSENHAL